MLERIAVEEAFVTEAVAAGWKKVLADGKAEPGFRKKGITPEQRRKIYSGNARRVFGLA